MTRPRAHNSSLPARTKPMPRSALGPGSSLRRTRIKPRNAKRAAWKFARNFHSKDFVEFTHSRPCWPCGTRDRIQAAHILEGRKMGGCGGDYTVTAPQCDTCHREWGAGPDRFLAARGLTWADAERAVAEHQAAWERYGGAT